MNIMHARYGKLTILLLLSVQPLMLCATDVNSKIVDGLGQSVPNALVDIHWLKTVSKEHVRKADLVKIVSDRHGIVKGKYDGSSVPSGEDIWVEISRVGYVGYSTTGLKPEFVLERDFDAADVNRIARLEGKAQIN